MIKFSLTDGLYGFFASINMRRLLLLTLTLLILILLVSAPPASAAQSGNSPGLLNLSLQLDRDSQHDNRDNGANPTAPPASSPIPSPSGQAQPTASPQPTPTSTPDQTPAADQKPVTVTIDVPQIFRKPQPTPLTQDYFQDSTGVYMRDGMHGNLATPVLPATPTPSPVFQVPGGVTQTPSPSANPVRPIARSAIAPPKDLMPQGLVKNYYVEGQLSEEATSFLLALAAMLITLGIGMVQFPFVMRVVSATASFKAGYLLPWKKRTVLS